MKKTLVLLLAIGLLAACNPEPVVKNQSEPAPVDSLIANWNHNWNTHDSAGIRNMFEYDALVIDNELVAEGIEKISAQWIQPGFRVINNLKTTKRQEWSTNDRAGYTGLYQFEVIISDTLIIKANGAFTVNWKKNSNSQWKITTAVIHSFNDSKE